MKKLALTIAVVLGLGVASFAQGSMFNRQSNAQNGSSGNVYYSESKVEGEGGGLMTPGLPGHGETGDQDATPLGSGIALLVGLGAAYLIGKRKEE